MQKIDNHMLLEGIRCEAIFQPYQAIIAYISRDKKQAADPQIV